MNNTKKIVNELMEQVEDMVNEMYETNEFDWDDARLTIKGIKSGYPEYFEDVRPTAQELIDYMNIPKSIEGLSGKEELLALNS